jgi:uncharacterized coiled-coil protein SlyX
MSRDGLTDHERERFAKITNGSPGQAEADDLTETVYRLEDTVTSLQSTVAELEADREKQREQIKALFEMVSKLQNQAADRDGDLLGATTLEKYASMEPAEREQLLSTSE